MPGITGIISRDAALRRIETVDAMVAVMRHEGFYKTGSRSLDTAGIGVGWAVHGESFADCNPVWNEGRDICLVITGEEFCGREKLDELRRQGHQFDGSDASYLVHWYEERGADFIEELNGTFSGVIIDTRQDLVILFNDRYGLGRVYVHESPEALHFASEAKSILRAVPATRAIDETGLAEFASCGCALQGRTLFSGVSLLPPASRWIFRGGKLERRDTYFEAKQWEELPPLPEAAFYEQLQQTFPGVVKKYFMGSLPVGMSLTGGLDGRMIMACSGHESGALPCYTFGGTYRDCTDVSLARRVAGDCGQPHQVITVDDDFIRQFGTLAEKSVYVSDGAMDVTGSVELFANARARQIAPVRMTGNYGSEILRSNVAFKPQALDAGLFNPAFVQAGVRAAAAYDEEARGRRLSLITMKQVPWHHHSRLAIEQSQLTMRSPYLDNEVVKLAYQAPTGHEFSKTPALRFVADQCRKLSRIPTDRGLLYRPTPGLTRLANLYQEFMFRAEYAYDYGMPQWLAPIDQRLKPMRPERAFLGRHKFYHFRVWYRDKLAGPLREVLLDPKTQTRSHVAPGRIKTLLDEHLSGTRNHTNALHQALSIELIHRQLIERAWQE
jgi:asparagine synthase (glutamine-hydrolysing)